MRRLVGLGGLVSLGGLVGVAAHRATSTEYPWSRPGATASTILEDPQWPADFPITSEHLKRLDETVDTSFYAQPRMVHHIDGRAGPHRVEARRLGDARRGRDGRRVQTVVPSVCEAAAPWLQP